MAMAMATAMATATAKIEGEADRESRSRGPGADRRSRSKEQIEGPGADRSPGDVEGEATASSGRIDIQLNVDIPEDTELVEPLQEGCVWRQARGAATEVSGAESRVASSEKVGVAQQWYDELDDLAFSTPEIELSAEEGNTSDGNSQEEGVCIDCAINTSPGTSEVVVYAALYLKLKRNPNSRKESMEKKAARIADILNPQRAETMGKDPCIEFLMKSERDPMGELVFMKPLCVRLKFDCGDHPKAADNSKEIILTDSSIEVNVSL